MMRRASSVMGIPSKSVGRRASKTSASARAYTTLAKLAPLKDRLKKKAKDRLKTKLSKADLIKYTQLFKTFDKDGSGQLDATELQKGLASNGDVCKLGDIEKFIVTIDGDDNGLIDLDEFLILMSMRHSTLGMFTDPHHEDEDESWIAKKIGTQKRDMSGLFRIADVFDCGHVTCLEILAGLELQTSCPETCTPYLEELLHKLRVSDMHAGEYLDLEDFETWVEATMASPRQRLVSRLWSKIPTMRQRKTPVPASTFAQTTKLQTEIEPEMLGVDGFKVHWHDLAEMFPLTASRAELSEFQRRLDELTPEKLAMQTSNGLNTIIHYAVIANDVEALRTLMARKEMRNSVCVQNANNIHPVALALILKTQKPDEYEVCCTFLLSFLEGALTAHKYREMKTSKADFRSGFW